MRKDDAPTVFKFLKSTIFSRFGVPKVLISDQRTNFCNKLLNNLWAKNGVSYRVSTSYHPQTNGLAEIIYEKSCHILVELEHRSYRAVKSCNADLEEAGLNQLLQIQELEEMRLDTYHSFNIYKEKSKLVHNANILRKKFKEGNKVLRYQAQFKFKKGKFKTSWDGPYTVMKVHDFGMIELKEEAMSKMFQCDGYLLKLYKEPIPPS
ncbi:uncharacterized protein LOC114761879 [Neltuma alba]|uniref:uncharacterized protein LOC114761879 n=1 Tax=Neltuma alba TaxID=207710 RepID=UPI0010A30B56|nr:uncharacterized protein LOC114761879 [Prosopis alba]